MKCTVNRLDLLSAARLASDIANPKSPAEIMTCVRLEVSGGSLALAATDSTTSLRATVNASKAAAGWVAVPARRMYDAVKALDGDQVSLSVDDTNRVELKSSSAKLTIPGRSGADFPGLPSTTGAPMHKVDPGAFAAAVRRTAFIVDPNEVRVFCQGVWFDGEKLVALNNHRLARANVTGVPGFLPVMVPANGLRRVIAAFEESEAGDVGVANGHFIARAPGTEITIRLIDASYPPWEQVIPKSKAFARAPRDLLLQAIRRAELMTTKDIAGIRLSVDGKVATVRASHATIGDATSDVELADEVNAASIVANHKYLAEALAAIDTDDVEVGLAGTTDPVVFRPAGTDAYMNLLMVMDGK